ncbi:MAG: ABC transporter ATP-binding protein [Planctomycetota bacterium]
MSEAPPLLELARLVVRYEVGPGLAPLTVLDGVDLAVAPGETVAVVGPSGAGKSTLLYAAGGLVSPAAGTVRIGGCDLATLGENELARLRNREIGFVFQDHYLLPQCTVLENALVPALAGWPGPGDAEARARELCARVGLAERLGHRPAMLSGGERQRAAVVRALINQPRLLLADEPTGSLDARTAAELIELIAALPAAHGVALLVVTHAPGLARRLGRVLELAAGRLSPFAAGSTR